MPAAPEAASQTGSSPAGPPAAGPAGEPGEAAAVSSAPAGWKAIAATYAPILIAAGTMTFFGLWGLARHQDMGNDEVVSRWAGALPLGRLAHVLLHIDAVHGLYYLILHGWMIAGTSPATIRFPSVVAMAAAAVLLVILARRLSGSALGRAVRRPDHGGDAVRELLRADCPLLCAGLCLRPRRDAGAAERARR